MSDNNKRASGKRPKKRKFTGNMHTRKKVACESASSKKLNSSCFESEEFETDTNFSGYRIVDIHLLFSGISKYICCKICGSEIEIKEASNRGLFSNFSLCCTICSELTVIKSCQMVGIKKNSPEINKRFVYAMRCVGNGLAGMQTFCSVMDLPPPIEKATYSKISRQILTAAETAANISQKKAAEDEISMTGDKKITISGDGSWKTRGFSSQIGITSVVGSNTGKILDVEVMSSFCKGCSMWKGPKVGPEFEEWKKKHNEACLKNHSGSAGKMEVDGMIKMFKRSEAKHNAQYVNYIGDGDTKTFPELQESGIYGPDIKLTKIECVGHVQKRMGRRLRELKKSMRGKKLKDGKVLGGKGRLTDKLINQLTIYYGNAIRNNKDSLTDMRKAVWAVFYHTRSCDKKLSHDFCPVGENSWCLYQQAKALGNASKFRHKKSVPIAVMDCVKPIFKDLSDPSLLRRCLGGKTQNNNESYNALVWKFCPKSSCASKIVAGIAANEAAVLFNEGRKGRMHIMKLLQLKIGQHAVNAALRLDQKRLKKAKKDAQAMTLEYRRAKRLQKISELEALAAKEGTLYKAGNF